MPICAAYAALLKTLCIAPKDDAKPSPRSRPTKMSPRDLKTVIKRFIQGDGFGMVAGITQFLCHSKVHKSFNLVLLA